MKKIITMFIFSFLFAYAKDLQQTTTQYLIVTDIVANIRAKPVDATTSYIKDDLQETQVLFNEPLVFKYEEDNWYYVECIEQQEFNHNNYWQGYPGFIKKSSVKFITSPPKYNCVVKVLSTKIYSASTDTSKEIITIPLGVRFEIVDETTDYYKVSLPIPPYSGWIKKSVVNTTQEISDNQTLRQNIIKTAIQLLGTPYLWGGRSALLPQLKEKIATGVDCSGFTSLVYRANNILIPRDAHEQWMASILITDISQLQPADLIFISKKDKPETIGHVMMYINEERFIESDTAGNENFVKFRTFKQKFGYTLDELKKLNFEVNGRKIYFGRVKELK